MGQPQDPALAEPRIRREASALVAAAIVAIIRTMNDVEISLLPQANGSVLSASAGIGPMLGWSAADFVAGRISLGELIHPDDADFAAILFATDSRPSSGVLSLRLRQADGRIRCVRASYARSPQADGAPRLDLRLQDAKSLPRTLDDASLTANFRAMMENSDDFIYFKDRNHVFTGASQTLVTLCDPAEHWTDLLGLTDYDVFPQELADGYYRLEKQVFAGLPVAHEVQRILGKDGRAGWVDNRKYPIRNDSGEIVGLFGVARDITRNVEAEQTERKVQRALRLLSDCNFAMTRSDSEGELLREICRAVVESGGYRMAWIGSAEHDATKTVRPLVCWGADDGYLAGIQVSWDEASPLGRGPTGEAIRSGRPQVNQNYLGNPGMAPWREAALRHGYQSSIALPMRLPQAGTFGAMMLYAREPDAFSAEEVKLLLELAHNVAFGVEHLRERERRHAAESASEAKSAFLANMSYEIRTPINAVMGMTLLALRADPPPRVRAYLEKIQSSGRHLLGVINDILDISKLEAGKVLLEQIEFNLHQLLDDVRVLVAEKAASKGLKLEFEVASDVPPTLMGDPLRLEQVLINLISNGIKFTERGGIAISVAVQELRPGQLVLRCAVRDTGIGLSDVECRQLFQTFQQADSSITRKYGGTGLGLAISKRLTELMGGQIGVDSRPGIGSTFWFTALLGLAGARPGQARPDLQARGMPAPATPSTEPAGIQALSPAVELQGARALLVEDNELNQEVATEFLQALGLQVELAENGAIALELLQRRPYDVVLMDMQMPVMDGLTATREIRQRPGLRELPVLAMTANAMAGDRERCLQAGMNDHIAKPLDPDELRATLRRWVRPALARASHAAAAAPDQPEPASRAASRPSSPAGEGKDWAALERIDGLDAGLGLGQAAGSQPLYLSLLAKFVTDQAGAADRLARAMTASDWELAERTAHTLKGVAAQIGALPLRDAALRLEQALRERRPATELERLLEPAARQLSGLVGALAAALPGTTRTRPAEPLDAAQWQILRARLLRLLEASDTDCLPLFEQHASQIRAALGERYDQVERAVRGFDFAAALAELERQR